MKNHFEDLNQIQNKEEQEKTKEELLEEFKESLKK